ncbi:MAG: hypothetical protein KF708_20430 [Pirellulales bacterium]|nr:hypothetical protein [Pirellulales bacterium]
MAEESHDTPADEPLPADPRGAEPSTGDPGYSSVQRYLLFGLSLPERALRTGAGLAAGALRESTALLVPQAFQNSKTYTVFVRQMLDYLAEDVGGVKRSASSETQAEVENFVARKAVGNFLEMASLATLHVSPITFLAIVSDVAYGSQTYLRELSRELKEQGIIDERSTIDHVDDLLAAVAKTSSMAATTFDTPPMSVEGLRQSIDETRQSIQSVDPTKVIPQAELERLWRDMQDLARREGVSVLDVSGTMALYSLDRMSRLGRGALSSVRVAGSLFDRHVVDHYEQAAAEIRRRGLYGTLAETSAPYIEAVWHNFSSDRSTITADLATGKLVGQAWGAVRRWLGGSD